ncbi:MAG: carbohydrate ABC transporter permease, partial [Bacilli bacterium]
MLLKKTFGERIFDLSNIGLMIILSIVTLYPLIFVLFASFSDPTFIAQNRGLLLYPHGITIEAYRLVFLNPNISTAYFNTMIYV